MTVRTSGGAKRQPRGSGRQRAYEALRSAILRLDLRPGEHLEEVRLAELAGGSRTLVREALVRLSVEGLVSLLPNRSAQVSSIGIRDVRDYFEALDLTQRAIARWAALRHSPRELEAIRTHMLAFEAAFADHDHEKMMQANFHLHRTIAFACSNMFISDSYIRIQDYGLRLSRLALTFDADAAHRLPARLEEICAEHRILVDRIAARDAEGAEQAAGEHARRGRDRVMRTLTSIQAANVSIGDGIEETAVSILASDPA